MAKAQMKTKAKGASASEVGEGREVRRRALAAVAAVALALPARLFAADPPPLPAVTLPPELARVLSDYEKAWSGRDAVALAALFAEDGFVLSPGNPPVRGRAAIEDRYRSSGGPLALHAFAYATEGRVGYILGGYAAATGAPDDGKFTLTLVRGGDGRWLIFSDMDNGNRAREP